MAAAIEVQELEKSFVLPLSRKKVPALRGLSFQVPEGRIVGFLGANGAGKTTTLKIIMSLIFPEKGTIKIFNKPHTEGDVRRSVGFLTERPYFYDYLTGREFLQFCAKLFDDPHCVDRVDPLLKEVGLAHAADRPLRRYSKGMLQRIGIAQALINDPKLLILDEPMSGLDPDGRAEICQIIRRSHKKGKTILFSTHLLPDVELLCDQVIMVDHGKLVLEEDVQALLNRETKGYEVVTQSGEHLHVMDVASVQKELQQLINAGQQIISVKPVRPTLEDIFLKFKGKGQ